MLVMVVPGTDAAFRNNHQREINRKQPEILYCEIDDKI
jgi:hypothetical protein